MSGIKSLFLSKHKTKAFGIELQFFFNLVGGGGNRANNLKMFNNVCLVFGDINVNFGILKVFLLLFSKQGNFAVFIARNMNILALTC